ncbi:MAG TPA: hypothetical protein ENI68_08040, partial [Gammaproteobacteria bacterium]|nr:hypothetical protein [Gammaproteobacteria bacterium]
MQVIGTSQFVGRLQAHIQVPDSTFIYAIFILLIYTMSAAFATAVWAVDIRVNAGGNAYTDGASNVWSADTGFNTGRISTAGSGVAITGTTDDVLYQVQRFDSAAAPDLIYSFAVPNGDYTVKLHFAENYSGVFSVGARVFGVQMEGATVISNLDIYGTVGANVALVRSVPVTVADGQMDIHF